MDPWKNDRNGNGQGQRASGKGRGNGRGSRSRGKGGQGWQSNQHHAGGSGRPKGDDQKGTSTRQGQPTLGTDAGAAEAHFPRHDGKGWGGKGGGRGDRTRWPVQAGGTNWSHDGGHLSHGQHGREASHKSSERAGASGESARDNSDQHSQGGEERHARSSDERHRMPPTLADRMKDAESDNARHDRTAAGSGRATAPMLQNRNTSDFRRSDNAHHNGDKPGLVARPHRRYKRGDAP